MRKSIDLSISSSKVRQERANDQVEVNGVMIEITWCRSRAKWDRADSMGPWKWTAKIVGHNGLSFSGWQYQNDSRNVEGVIEDLSDHLNFLNDKF